MLLQAYNGRKLLVTGHKRVGNATGGGRTCMAEDVCINKFCGNGYDHTANKFPFTVTYSKFPTQYNTKFEFDVSPSHRTKLQHLMKCTLRCKHPALHPDKDVATVASLSSQHVDRQSLEAHAVEMVNGRCEYWRSQSDCSWFEALSVAGVCQGMHPGGAVL